MNSRNRIHVLLSIVVVTVVALAPTADAAIVVDDNLVSGTRIGTLLAIDVPYQATLPAYGGPDWTDDADDGFMTGTLEGQGGIMEKRSDSGSPWEPDGTPIDQAGAYMTYRNAGAPDASYTFDIPDGVVVNAVYATWLGRNKDGAIYSYTEGAESAFTDRDPEAPGNQMILHSIAPAADLVLDWTDAAGTIREANFQAIFTDPITVADGDGFTLYIDDTNQGNASHIDTVVIDYGSPIAPTDFDQDGDTDLDDVNMLTAAADLSASVPAALVGPEFDLNADEVVDGADLDQWLADAATINGFASPYLKGDANVDGDVDVWAFDGTGDAQVLSSNLGTMTGMVWGDADFNGDGDVDVWAFDGSGDAQQLSSNLGATNDVPEGTVQVIYNAVTGELSFDVGAGIGVIGVQVEGLKHELVDFGSPLGAPGQNSGNILAYFSASGLPVGLASVGSVLPTGLTADDIAYSYTPIGNATAVPMPVKVIVPEPSTIAMLLVVAAMALCRWRRRV